MKPYRFSRDKIQNIQFEHADKKNTVVVAEYYFQYNKNEYDKLTMTRNSVTKNLKPTSPLACQTEQRLLPGKHALPLI